MRLAKKTGKTQLSQRVPLCKGPAGEYMGRQPRLGWRHQRRGYRRMYSLLVDVGPLRFLFAHQFGYSGIHLCGEREQIFRLDVHQTHGVLTG
jgi:hypothetical protein